jgi:hypothetical protein
MVEIDGKRMVAWNGDLTDENGIIWCMVKEDTPGYFPMTGKDELQAPWYLAHFEYYRKANGVVDYMKARESAEKLAKKYNEENGYTEKDVQEILASSIRLGKSN